MIRNKVVKVVNYATDKLQETLDWWGKAGYTLVSAVLAKNEYNLDVMYLFFTQDD